MSVAGKDAIDEIFKNEAFQNMSDRKIERLLQLEPNQIKLILLVAFTGLTKSTKRFVSLSSEDQSKYIDALMGARNYNIANSAADTFAHAHINSDGSVKYNEVAYLELAIIVTGATRDYQARCALEVCSSICLCDKEWLIKAINFLLTAVTEQEANEIGYKITKMALINKQLYYQDKDKWLAKMTSDLDELIGSYAPVEYREVNFFEHFLADPEATLDDIADLNGPADVAAGTKMLIRTRKDPSLED